MKFAFRPMNRMATLKLMTKIIKIGNIQRTAIVDQFMYLEEGKKRKKY